MVPGWTTQPLVHYWKPNTCTYNEQREWKTKTEGQNVGSTGKLDIPWTIMYQWNTSLVCWVDKCINISEIEIGPNCKDR